IQLLLLEAEELRRDHPGCGVEKMYHTLKPDFIGRDRFIDVFIIDVYTKKIVGHQLSNSMRADANVKAMEMALKNNKAPKIH
ncbi:hypothetical protein VR479_12960, partial [Aquirufa aurantiipilula]